MEITSIRGAGLRCYKLIERESEPPQRHSPPTRPSLSVSELYNRLISIMVDKEPEPIHVCVKNLTIFISRFFDEICPMCCSFALFLFFIYFPGFSIIYDLLSRIFSFVAKRLEISNEIAVLVSVDWILVKVTAQLSFGATLVSIIGL